MGARRGVQPCILVQATSYIKRSPLSTTRSLTPSPTARHRFRKQGRPLGGTNSALAMHVGPLLSGGVGFEKPFTPPVILRNQSTSQINSTSG